MTGAAGGGHAVASHELSETFALNELLALRERGMLAGGLRHQARRLVAGAAAA